MFFVFFIRREFTQKNTYPRQKVYFNHSPSLRNLSRQIRHNDNLTLAIQAIGVSCRCLEQRADVGAFMKNAVRVLQLCKTIFVTLCCN